MGLVRTLLPPRDPRAELLGSLKHRVERELGEPAFRRDPVFIQQHLPRIAGVFGRYFAAEVRGTERLPREGPFLLVSNHSGGLLMPDAWALFHALVTELGIERELYGLTFDLPFGLPGVAEALRRLGAVPASMRNAEHALALGAGVLVYPGGSWEVYRPWSERNRIELHGHTGFVRLALRHGVPVFPTVSHGSHDSLIVVSRGARLSRVLGIDRLRVDIFPITLGFPLGLTTIFAPYLPLPSKIVVEVLDPLDWSGHGPAAADDPDVVRACYDEAVDRMQEALDRLVHEIPHPLLARIGRVPWPVR